MILIRGMNINNRNFNTISPSAKSLLLMKGYTNIPFARQAAELMHPGKFNPDFSGKDINFWARVVHFEKRYWSIDQLLSDLPVKNILELSSGFSFRGLEIAKEEGFYYIDTDLPDVIAAKKDFIEALKIDGFKMKGILELLPLNALDDKQFHRVAGRFPDGKIVIVNEGLLMYFDKNEKEKLCGIIYNLLKERGGYWITSDIYIKNKQEKSGLKIEDKTREFYEQHNIEEKKFESFEEARAFFNMMGFKIDKEANVRRTKLSSMKHFLNNASAEQLLKIRSSVKIQATWRLRI